MRVFEVVEPGVDGVFRHVEGLIQYLLKKNVSVDLAYSSVRGSADLFKLVELVRNHGGLALDLAINNVPGLGDFRAYGQLLKVIHERKPDLIHGHSSKAGALVRLLRPFVGRTPIFFTPHAYYAMGNVVRASSGFFNLIEKLLSGIGTTINISQDEADFARRVLYLSPAKQRIIHNPVSDVFFTTQDETTRQAAREELDIPESSTVLGTVARLAEQKDPETLYHAFALALKNHPDLMLLHLGEGPLKEKIQSTATRLGISHRVRLLRYRDHPLTVYQAMDGLIMSSRYEAGWPISILEALAQDLPIISTTCPGCLNIAEASLSHCWTAPVGDPERLADAISAWVQDQPLRRPSNHRAMAMERFGTDRCYGAVLEEYRLAIST